MELYTKELLIELNKDITGESFYLPKVLFDTSNFASVRLETKMAYVAILDTLLKGASYTKEGIAYIKSDNPEISKTLATLANKQVDQDKINKYLNELDEANLININKKDVLVYCIR